MGSVAPPDSGAGASSSGLLVPRSKIEPNTDPFDEPSPPSPFFAGNLNWNPSLIPSVPTVIVPDSDPIRIPSSPPTPLPDSADYDLAEALEVLNAPLPEDGNVYAEFARVSEMLRLALGKSSNNHQQTESTTLDSESGAIVAVPAESGDKDLAIPTYKRQKRSKELVRVSNLTQEDHTYYRDIVRRTRMLFDSIRLFAMFQGERLGTGGGRKARADLLAENLMKRHSLCLNRDKRIVGSIPGVFVGDIFFFRMELFVVGLHCQVQAGIDYLPASDSPNGEPIATSIVVSGGYEDDDDRGDVLEYTGHGGRDKKNVVFANQKLEGGNLALEKSMNYGIEIRVIRGFKYQGSLTSKVYVYDGLYRIVDSWFDTGKSGFGVYKFKLLRIEGQPEMGTSNMKFAKTLRVKPLELRPKGYMTLDLSCKKESVPIFLFNDIDFDNDPMRYEYLPRTIFPPSVYHASGNTAGCGCAAGCTDDCLCARKNGGEISFDQFGFLLRGKPLIFECGPNCRCPPSCRNRVSQKGVKFRLEVFRSNETGWGVRTLDLIHAGSFICEYAGIALSREQAEVCSMGGDCLIYPGRFAPRWREWGDLSQVYPEYVRPSEPSLPPLDFAMDVSTFRNVACYMNHSICPNVMVQFVLYDHSNMMFPHMMLFAMENIAPMKELSIDYGVPDEYTGKLSICHN